jgi:dTDP-4-amino-4,6-dideoxygalactose transaminase
MINVTKTFLPPQEEYQSILNRAWQKGWITNRGVLVKELEEKLKDHLKIPNIIAMTNGTLPIQIAIKAFGLKGEIITPAFSYVATTSSIVWEDCTPVFVDIHPEYLTIDEGLIEAAITDKTVAILATHVFGNPCDVHAIENIARNHNLKVIYDAAHCFGVAYNGKSIFEYGDVSTCSFHATKLFHTGEGGALVCKPEYFTHMYFHHNFGHDGPDTFRGLGINAKMSELQAALGLAVLPYMDLILENRKRAVEYYDDNLDLRGLKIREGTQWNYAYYPVIFNSEADLLRTKQALNESDINPRRYFYPSLDSLEYTTKSNLPLTHSIAKSILCLPLSHDLSNESLDRIVTIVKKANH